MSSQRKFVFAATTPLGFVVHCTRSYWDFIVSEKHPTLDGRERDVERVLVDPDEIRQSRRDENVLLFYRGKKPRWLCAVVKKGDHLGFLITAYPTDSIKVGEVIWKK